MAVRPNSAAAPSNIPIGVVIASIAILAILIIGVAWHVFGSHTGGAPNRPLTADQVWFQQTVKASGGDYSKLSQDDKRKLYTIDGVQGPFLLQQAANNSKSGK